MGEFLRDGILALHSAQSDPYNSFIMAILIAFLGYWLIEVLFDDDFFG
ncbi:hypothetical protein UFOVP671_27 [uncultured Caudovirales phage]|uniref:Uncharacterized protein n=1 Tax=uncultured Caudovirales phage TaxID=2100421 RepID=A0A6J5NFS9_9CAUD|nr:hypothetical protein UFOVP671_27 [uncultured Caudovirales phage]